MTGDMIKNQYFEWMYKLGIGQKIINNKTYVKLFEFLNNIDFSYILPMDDNRAMDGIDLRYRFGHDNSYENYIITKYLDDRPCSVLEMMIALSLRCEESIMDNPDIGNRISKWFWDMIINLGLSKMSDDCFDKKYVETAVNRFMTRQYEANGKGGLFIIRNRKQDLRNVEIWYQACWYLDEILEKGE